MGVSVVVSVGGEPFARLCAATAPDYRPVCLSDAEEWLVSAAVGAADRLSRESGLRLLADGYATVWSEGGVTAVFAGVSASIAHPLAAGHFTGLLGDSLGVWAMGSLGCPLALSKEVSRGPGDFMPRAARMMASFAAGG